MAAIAGEPILTNAQAKDLVRWGFESDPTKTGGSDIVKAARKSFQEGNPDDALGIVSRDKLIPLKSDVERILVQNLSTQRDASGKKEAPTNNPNEYARYTTAKNAAEDVRMCIESDQISSTLKDKVKVYLLGDPRFAKIMTDNTVVQNQDTYTEAMMKLPGYKDKLRSVYTRTLSPSRRQESSANVQQLQAQLQALEAKKVAQVDPKDILDAKAEVAAAKAALTTPQTVKDIQDLEGYDKILKRDAEKIQQDRATLRKTESRIRDTLHNRKILQSNLDSLIQQNSPQKEITDKRAEIDTVNNGADKSALNLVDTLRAEIEVYEDIEQKASALRAQLAPIRLAVEQAEAKLAELQARAKSGLSAQEQASLDAQIAAKKIEVTDAEAIELSDMILYASEITSMPETAMQEFLTEAFTQLKKLWTAEATKEMEKVGTVEASLAESAADKLENAWRKISQVKMKNATQLSIFENDQKLITPWLQLILDPAKQHELFSTGFGINYLALISSIPDTDTTLKDRNLLFLGLTIHEVKALKKFIKDPKWMKEQMVKWRGDLLGDYFLSGGQMNEAVTKYLARDPNGRELLNRAVAAAREKASGHQAAKSQVEQIELELKQLYGREFARQNNFDWRKWRPYLFKALLAAGILAVSGAGLYGVASGLGALATILSAGSAASSGAAGAAATATATATAAATAAATATATPMPPVIGGGVQPGMAP